MVKRGYKFIPVRQQTENAPCTPLSWTTTAPTNEIFAIDFLGLQVTSPQCASTPTSTSGTRRVASSLRDKMHLHDILPISERPKRLSLDCPNVIDVDVGLKADVDLDRYTSPIESRPSRYSPFKKDDAVNSPPSKNADGNPRISDWSTVHVTSDSKSKMRLINSKPKLKRFQTELRLNDTTSPARETRANISTDSIEASFVSAVAYFENIDHEGFAKFDSNFTHNTTGESVNISGSDSSVDGSPLNLSAIYKAYRRKLAPRKSRLSLALKARRSTAKRGMRYNVRNQTIVSVDDSASSLEQASDSGVEMDAVTLERNHKKSKKERNPITGSFDIKKYFIGEQVSSSGLRFKSSLSNLKTQTSQPKNADDDVIVTEDTEQLVEFPLNNEFHRRQRGSLRKKLNSKLTNLVACGGCSKSQSIPHLNNIECKPHPNPSRR